MHEQLHKKSDITAILDDAVERQQVIDFMKSKISSLEADIAYLKRLIEIHKSYNGILETHLDEERAKLNEIKNLVEGR